MKKEAFSPSQDISEALDNVANHDIKAISYLGLESDGPFTTTGLGKHMVEKTDFDEVKHPATSYPITFNNAGFAETHEGPPHRGQPSRMFTATRQESALPVIGEMLEWSETHDIPLMDALSFTASKGSKAPTNSIQIFDTLNKGQSIGDVHFDRYQPTKEGWSTAYNTRLMKMVEQGFVEIDDDPTEFQILDPTYKGSKPIDTLSTGHQLAYRTLQEAKLHEDKEMWVISDLERLAIEKDIAQEDQIDALHKSLTRAASIATPDYFPGAIEKVELRGRRYKLSSEYADAIDDLVSRVAMLDTSDTTRKSAESKAKDIYLDQETLQTIALRGIIASPFIKNN